MFRVFIQLRRWRDETFAGMLPPGPRRKQVLRIPDNRSRRVHARRSIQAGLLQGPQQIGLPGWLRVQHGRQVYHFGGQGDLLRAAAARLRRQLVRVHKRVRNGWRALVDRDGVALQQRGAVPCGSSLPAWRGRLPVELHGHRRPRTRLAQRLPLNPRPRGLVCESVRLRLHTDGRTAFVR